MSRKSGHEIIFIKFFLSKKKAINSIFDVNTIVLWLFNLCFEVLLQMQCMSSRIVGIHLL